MATPKELLGQVQEDLVKSILRNLFPANEGFRITFPDKANYNNHHGVDFKVFQRHKEVLALECKNWRKLGYKYGTDTAQTEVIDRFNHVGTNLRITVLSFLEVFNNNALNQIRANGIKLIETQKLVGHKDFRTELYRTLLTAIQKLFKENKKSPRVLFNSSNQSTLDRCVVSKSQSTNLNSYIPTNNDTPREDTNRPLDRFPDKRRFIDEPRFSHY